MSKLIHTSCGGKMKNFRNGIRCSRCGYTLKRKEVNKAFMSGKLDLPVKEGPAEEMKIIKGINLIRTKG